MTPTRTTRSARGRNARTTPAWGHAGSRRGTRAFSLMEVLIALGIFALGLVAVAAVFPTAIAIQSETVRDLAGQRAIINARSTIQALARSQPKPLPLTDFRVLSFKKTVAPLTGTTTYSGTLAPYADATPPAQGRTGYPGGVQPMIDQPMTMSEAQQHGTLKMVEMSSTVAQLNAPRSFHDLFSVDTRSYPKNIADPYKRDYYWYPLIQASDLTGATSTWKVFVMVMQRRGTEAVPEVRAAGVTVSGNKTFTLNTTGPYALDNDLDNNGLPDLIQPGDYLLGEDGSIFRAIVAGRNEITIDSQIPLGANLNLIYYAVARDGLDGSIKRETRSAIVRIDQFDLVVNEQP